MLISEITPSAKKVNMVTPFSSTTIDLNYMSVIARPYIPGADENGFQVRYGEVATNDDGDIIGFQGEESQRIILTKEELSTWGTNDEDLYQIIAKKIGVSIVSFHNV